MHERNPSWCVAFIRFKEPSAAYSAANKNQLQSQITTEMSVKPILVVENDCVSVNIINNKSSMGKTCSMTMRAGEVFYPGAVAPGDWCLVWMSDYQDDIDTIINALNNLNSTNKADPKLSDWYSGLKFVGRVTSSGYNDTVADSGTRPFIQNITAQSFLEFASSVYYTELAQGIYTQGFANGNVGSQIFQNNGLTSALGDLAGKFIKFWSGLNPISPIEFYPQPDIAIAFYLVIALGVSKEKDFTKEIFGNLDGVMSGIISDAIQVPPVVSAILGKTGVKLLWQMMNFYLGLQKYSPKGISHWRDFAPNATVLSSNGYPVFFKTPDRCKGWTPYMPTPWDNKSLWSILNEYLNPALNEIYTVLRCDITGQIRPSIVVREQPFGTSLYGSMHTKKFHAPVQNKETTNSPNQNQSQLPDQPQQNAAATSIAAADQAANNNVKQFTDKNATDPYATTSENTRAMYGNLPRWVIDESMIKSVNLAAHEQDRVNFVQVWGRNIFNGWSQPSAAGNQTGSSSTPNPSAMELDRSQQMIAGNMVADDADIKRNGLRANVVESPFDYPVPFNSRSDRWARMRADWLFNGHLKVRGTILANGIREPICEGDNVQVRGLVLHIQEVTHTGLLGQDGKKRFTTSLQVFNGITAESLDKNTKPTYLCHTLAGGGTGSADGYRYIPGTTDIQYTTKKNRDLDGERGTGDNDPNNTSS